MMHATDAGNAEAGRPGGLHHGHYTGRKLRCSCQTFAASQTVCTSRRCLWVTLRFKYLSDTW